MVVRKFCGVYRQLWLRIEDIKFIPIASRFLGRMNKIKAVLGSAFKAFTVKLKKAIRLINWLLNRLFLQKYYAHT
ncbi:MULTISPECIES: hypothetical protein [unclassified Bartonella]|uniref:hypothetical protein n=1 Tax=Bartonella TaxID=773 RepID=UPI0035CFC255